jgi:oligopeptide/dipeptide ABC transporter ATP-binding protein
MYLGKIVEIGKVEDIYRNPQHPYTKALLSAIPRLDQNATNKRQILTGDIPSPLNRPSGCAFHTRCPIAVHACSQNEPNLRSVRNIQVACDLVV